MRCLHRSLALQWLLRRPDIHADRRIGVRKDGEALVGHAWLEYGGAPLTESAEIEGQFLPLVGIEPPISRKTRIGGPLIRGFLSIRGSLSYRVPPRSAPHHHDHALPPSPPGVAVAPATTGHPRRPAHRGQEGRGGAGRPRLDRGTEVTETQVTSMKNLSIVGTTSK